MLKIAKNAGWLLGGRGANALFSLGYLALATRTLGLEGFGQFALVIGLAQATVGLASFQTWQLVVRWGSRDKMTDAAVGFALALDILAVALGVGGIALVLTLFGSSLLGEPSLVLPAFLTTCAFLAALKSTPLGLLRLHDRYGWAVGAEAMVPALRFAGAALAAAIWPTISAFLVAWAVAELVSAAALWLLSRKVHRFALRTVGLRSLPAVDWSVWRFVLGTSSNGSVSVVSRQLMLVAIGALGGPAMAGIYRVAAQLGLALFKLANSLMIALFPALVWDAGRARETTARLTRIAAAAALVAVAIAALAGKYAIGVIAGPAFLVAFVPMLALTVASAAELITTGPEALLVARGRSLAAFSVRLVPTLTVFAALPWLVPRFGASGAAGAVALAALVTLGGMIVSSRRPLTAEMA